MRNLKRALSLALASVMVLGLMVVGSSAKGYDDVTSEENVEAIEVLQAVGIMTGDDNGNFNPTQNVTRNEMAVIMSNLMDYRVATYKGTSPFTDVPEWAEPYVAACYTNGIIAGYSATTFGGSDPVVTSQATLMILKALGYFKYSSDFGDDWQLATINQANKVDLLVDVDSAVRVPMTRNDVAQLVLNGLETGMVEVDDSDKMNIVVGDVQITSGTNYVYTTSREKYAEAIKKDTLADATSSAALRAPIVELGEKLYQGDLRKDEAEDAFGRPSNNWVYLNKEIGKYAEEADYEWTGKVTAKALYDAVGRTATDSDYAWTVTVDGKSVDNFATGSAVYTNRNDDDKCFLRWGGQVDGKNINDDAGEEFRTGNGAVTQVFVDSTKDDEKVHVAVMHRYAAEVLRVDETDGTITLSDLSQWGEAAAKDEFEATGYAEDDVVIYTWAEGKIQEVYPAERMEGEVSRVRVETNEAGYGDNFVADGETYNYNHTMKKADKLVSENVNNNVVAYLDANGYVAYIDQSAVTYDYAYVLSIGTDGDSYGGTNRVSGDTYYARLVLTDGSLVKAQVDVKKQAASSGKTVVENTVAYWQGQIVSYSEDSKGVYTLSSTKDDTSDTANTYAVGTGLDIESGVASFTAGSNANRTRYSANSQTVFILATPDENDLDDYNFSVYTGIANVPDVEGKADTVMAVSTGNKTGSVAKVVYIEDAETSGEDVIFIRTDREAKEQRDSELGSYYELNAWIDGERTTLNVKKGTSAADVLVRYQGNDWMKVNETNRAIVAAKSLTYNSDDLVTSVKLYSPYDASTGDGYITGTGYDDTENETVVLADGSYSWDRDALEAAQYNNKNESNAFETLRVTGMRNDGNDLYLAVLDGDVITGLCVRYVKDGEGDFEAPEVKKSNVTVIFAGTGLTVTLDGEAVTSGVAKEITGSAILRVTGVPTGKVAVATIGSEKYTLTSGAYTLTPTSATTTVTLTLEDETTTYPWVAPSGVVYSLDGKNWANRVEFDSKKDSVIYVKPQANDFFFTQTPSLTNGLDTSVSVEKSDGNSYAITVTAAGGITRPGIPADLVYGKMLKLTDASLYTKLVSPYIFLRFEESNGNWAWTKDSSGNSIFDDATTLELAKEALKETGAYREVVIDGNSVIAKDNGDHQYTVPVGNINCVGTLVTINGEKIMRNADASIGNTPELTDSSSKILVKHADGTTKLYANKAAATDVFRDGDVISYVANDYVEAPKTDTVPNMPPLDANKRAEVQMTVTGQEKDLTGLLSEQEVGGQKLWNQDPSKIDYSKLNGKAVTSKILVLPESWIPTGATKLQITQKNEAVKIFDETSGTDTLTGSAHTITAIKETDGTIQIAYIIAEGCPVTFTLTFTDDSSATVAIVTVTIDTNGVTIR